MFRLFSRLTLILSPAMAAIGCQSPCGVGWSYQIGKPAYVQQSTVLGPQVTTFAGQGFASTPIGVSHALAAQVGELEEVKSLPMPRTVTTSKALQPASACTLDEICRRLAALTEAVNKMASYKPMPGGEE